MGLLRPVVGALDSTLDGLSSSTLIRKVWSRRTLPRSLERMETNEKDREPVGFYQRLDALLADSGMRTANDLAAGFGIELHDPEFWRGGFKGYRADIAEYESLVAQARP